MPLATSVTMMDPATQSLRNAGGADFREIILVFAQSVMGSARYIAKTKSRVEEALGYVPDISVRAILAEELAIAKRLREENASLRFAFSRLAIPSNTSRLENHEEEVPIVQSTRRIPRTSVLPGPGSSNEARPALGGLGTRIVPLAAGALEALREGVDRRRIRTLGFMVLDDGSIVNARGDSGLPKRVC